MNKEKCFIDLSKLSKKQIKSLPQIFENAGHTILSETLSDLISGKITDGFKFLFYSPSGWNQNDYPLNGRTELNYPEFIKLFEGETCPKCRTKDFKNCHSIRCPMRNETIKSDNNETLANDLQQIEELEADKAELLDVLIKARDLIKRRMGLKIKEMESLIQKHKK